MITIERTNYAFARVDASSDEWKAIGIMVRYAESIYDQTELRYRLMCKEEECRTCIQDVISMLDVEGDPPIELIHRRAIHTILCCIREMDSFDVPSMDTVLKSTIIDQVRQYHTADIFDDEKATDEQIECWTQELCSKGS